MWYPLLRSRFGDRSWVRSTRFCVARAAFRRKRDVFTPAYQLRARLYHDQFVGLRCRVQLLVITQHGPNRADIRHTRSGCIPTAGPKWVSRGQIGRTPVREAFPCRSVLTPPSRTCEEVGACEALASLQRIMYMYQRRPQPSLADVREIVAAAAT